MLKFSIPDLNLASEDDTQMEEVKEEDKKTKWWGQGGAVFRLRRVQNGWRIVWKNFWSGS